MKTIQIPTHDETLVKIQSAMDKIGNPSDKESISFSFSELLFLKRLILMEEATLELSYEAVGEHIKFVEKLKEENNNG